ncbi:DmsE family decaheme c-type cytochrome [Blastochloris sulfoviridis]|uniref:DmsE family decaheme c-type cytochrome n=1 Tax=Blastochloris sulfoviridis TaxID=50712 RepID=UPI001FE72614|nr:DmsE family decaheme c-type cytochrome [Blastochloris sulfoviridis]
MALVVLGSAAWLGAVTVEAETPHAGGAIRGDFMAEYRALADYARDVGLSVPQVVAGDVAGAGHAAAATAAHGALSERAGAGKASPHAGIGPAGTGLEGHGLKGDRSTGHGSRGHGSKGHGLKVHGLKGDGADSAVQGAADHLAADHLAADHLAADHATAEGVGAADQPIVVAQADVAQPAPKPKKRAKAAAAAEGHALMVMPAPDDPEGRYYVGSKPCETCHAGLFDEFSKTIMGRNILSGKATPQGKMECESCHGPGSGHVNAGGGREAGHIRSFRKTDPRFSVADANGVCLSCHEKGEQTYWRGSTHENRDVACVDCHTVMRKTTPRFQLAKTSVMDTCFQCHKDRRAQSLRTAHMPIREGKITCANCHNPHGSATEAMLKGDTVNDTCYTCHAEKRGPFLFEHPPVRENCLNCHEPHGSMHDKLLVVARERLCQRCHTNRHNQAGLGVLGATANALRYAVGSSCQNCHTNIHGSNSPSGARWHR